MIKLLPIITLPPSDSYFLKFIIWLPPALKYITTPSYIVGMFVRWLGMKKLTYNLRSHIRAPRFQRRSHIRAPRFQRRSHKIVLIYQRVIIL